nr:RHS repeat domain-containing protein [Streptomyces sp. NRRL F-2664]
MTHFGYDESGHLTTVTDPRGAVTRIRTDRAGLPLAVTDRLGATTTYERDAFGRVTASPTPWERSPAWNGRWRASRCTGRTRTAGAARGRMTGTA